MRPHESILEYRGARHLKLAAVLCALAAAAYAWYALDPSNPPYYGGTWLGYTLGGVSAVLVVWLLALGVRRRAYRSVLGTVEGWTSAHVYFGVAVAFTSALHAGFEFGCNVHTLAYVLLLLTVASGIVGVYLYLSLPPQITRNLAGETLEAILLRIADLDRQCRRLAFDLPDEVAAIVTKAARAHARELSAAGPLRRRLRGERVRCPTREACAALRLAGVQLSGEAATRHEQLLRAMTQKSALIARVRRHLRMNALLQVWLYAHVPLALGLLGALVAHVLAVFYFW